MARPQEFDQNAVLKAAMLQFWHDGYAGTSMAKLLKVTGLTPSSFYNAFGSKRTLFLKTLEHYNVRVVGARNRRLLGAEDPVAGIEDFFLSSFEPYPKGDFHGCMLGSTSVEFGDSDADIRRVVWAGLRSLENAFKNRIADAKSSSRISHQLDEASAAQHLLSCFQGMTVIGRLTQDKSRLRKMTKSAMASLGPAQVTSGPR